jgi:UDP-2,4-diacetamido-2,4,6-trideoxy-beta-L-altropyranose hydrolase
MGTGHVMRCLALAQAWQDAGGTAHFLCAEVPDGLASRLMAEGMVLHHLSEAPGGRQDAQRTVALAQQVGATWVVEDGYHFGADYQRAIKDAGLRLLAIDDYGHAEHYVADLVINQNIYADESLYPSREPTTRLLLGTKYALLRREFWPWRGWHRTIPDVAQNILVTMGGGDPNNQTLKVIRAIQTIKDIDLSVVVVVGGGNPHLKVLKEAIAGGPSIQLIQNAINMPELMAWADVAVSAGGSTCWELCFLGTPPLLLITAENQRHVAHGLASARAAVNLDWYEDLEILAIANSLTEVMLSAEQRIRLSENGRQLVNGTGLSSILCYLQGTELTLRRANQNDCRTIWEWANDPVTRQNSFRPETIPWESHVAWFTSKLADPDTLFLVATNSIGEAIGYVRFELVTVAQAVISVAVAPTQRGRGYGKYLIVLGMQEVQRITRLNVVHAYIKTGNQASIHAFTSAGYSETEMMTINGCSAFHYVWCGQGGAT